MCGALRGAEKVGALGFSPLCAGGEVVAGEEVVAVTAVVVTGSIGGPSCCDPVPWPLKQILTWCRPPYL